MKWRAYPKYKDSGIEWLGGIPAHWNTTRVKHLANSDHESFIDGDWIESPYITNEGIRLVQTGNIGVGRYREQGYRYISEDTFDELLCTEVMPGDVLICRLAAPVGRACIAPNLGVRMITSVDVCILKPQECHDSRYVVHFLSSDTYLNWIESLSRGSTRARISRSMLGDIEFVVPPPQEQRAIAAFLDRETERIDALIARKGQQIELLQEKRTALISHVVTKGLDPNAPMKDSGVEWLDQYPATWTGLPLKRWVQRKITDGPHETPELVEEGIDFISAEAIQDGHINFEARRGYITEELHGRYCKKCCPRVDDIFLCKSGATTGKLAMVEEDREFSVWSPLAQIRADQEEVLPHFLFLALQADYVQNQIRRTWSAGTQPNIAMSAIERLFVVAPPLDMQREILTYVERFVGAYEPLITTIRRSIERLREYRTALISAAVTGKIDVRQEVA